MPASKVKRIRRIFGSILKQKASSKPRTSLQDAERRRGRETSPFSYKVYEQRTALMTSDQQDRVFPFPRTVKRGLAGQYSRRVVGSDKASMWGKSMAKEIAARFG